MTRLTEYHNGVAVIKNKNFKEAAEKLAMYEDIDDRIRECFNLAKIEKYRCPADAELPKWMKSFRGDEMKGGGSDE